MNYKHFPEGRGDIHYKDDRICVFPVKLEPGKTYVLWLNRGKYNSFREVMLHLKKDQLQKKA